MGWKNSQAPRLTLSTEVLFRALLALAACGWCLALGKLHFFCIYRYKARFSRIQTVLPDVTHYWLQPSGVTLLNEAEFKLFFRARFGLLPLNAHRGRKNRAARCCAYCSAHGRPVIETLAHVFSACPRYRNVMRLRHDAVAKLVLGAVLQALESGGARRG